MSKIICTLQQHEHNIVNYKYEDFEEHLTDNDYTSYIMPTIDFNVDKDRIIRQIMADKSIDDILNILYEVKGKDNVIAKIEKIHNNWEYIIR